jgi:hypothetical protein
MGKGRLRLSYASTISSLLTPGYQTAIPSPDPPCSWFLEPPSPKQAGSDIFDFTPVEEHFCIDILLVLSM